ncbi:MAG TPA: hypothetical protein VLL97_09730, partial [Acidobacteriota bacterium]|nr:hypothetical protein [Acidobacteriota bacterium]
ALMLKVLYLQWMMGYTSRYVGVYQAVMAGSMLLASLVAGYLNDKAHPRWPVLLGLPICVYGIYLASRLTLHHDLPGILRMGVILGVGAAFIMVPLSVAVFATISHRDMGAATVLNSYLSVVSGGISLALVTALLMHRIDVNAAHLSRAVMPDNPAVTAVMRLAGADLAQPMLYEQVMRQSAMFAFNDVLYLMSFILPLLLIYLPFMKKAPTGDDNEA